MWHYFCGRGKSESMIADQNVQFDFFLECFWFDFSVMAFHPGFFFVKYRCEPNKPLCMDGSWLEEDKYGFNFHVGYSMLKIWHSESIHHFRQNFKVWSATKPIFIFIQVPVKILEWSVSYVWDLFAFFLFFHEDVNNFRWQCLKMYL